MCGNAWTMDMKEPGNLLFLVGTTADAMGGSLYQLVTGQTGGQVPAVDLAIAPRIFAAVHEGDLHRHSVDCHTVRRRLAVAVAEMAFAGGVGADVDKGASGADAVRLFAESPTRFLIEVRPRNAEQFRRGLRRNSLAEIGRTVKEPRLRIAGADGGMDRVAPLARAQGSLAKTTALVILPSTAMSAAIRGGHRHYDHVTTYHLEMLDRATCAETFAAHRSGADTRRAADAAAQSILLHDVGANWYWIDRLCRDLSRLGCLSRPARAGEHGS